MVSSDISSAAASGFLFISNLLSTVKIDKLIVPEFSVQWLFNREDTPVYEWIPPKEPIVRGILENRLDLSHKASLDPLKERRAIKILNPDETLSGEYMCIVKNTVSEARERGNMLVFSPQHELALDWHNEWDHESHHHEVQVTCLARGVFPQPNLMLEKGHVPVDSQEQKIWRSGDGALFDTKTVAKYRHIELRNTERFTCRLEIPDAGYVAINEKIIVFRNSSHNFLEYKNNVVIKNDNTTNNSFQTDASSLNVIFILMFLICISLR